MNVANQISEKIMVELGVIEKPEPQPQHQHKVASGDAAADAEKRSQEIWANLGGGDAPLVPEGPRTSRQMFTRNKWIKDEVLHDLDKMRGDYVTFSGDTASIKAKQFDNILSVIQGDLLNCIEQAGFIVKSGASTEVLKNVLGMYLQKQTLQYDNGKYHDVEVTD